MKAQSFFGGTNPKNTGKDSTNRQVGHSSATPGVNAYANTRGQADTSTKASLSRRPAGRPNLHGKVDNRKVGQ